MNDKVRHEIEEIAKGFKPENPPANENPQSGLKADVFITSDPDIAEHLLGTVNNLHKLIKDLEQQNLPPNVIAGIIFSMLLKTKACVLINLYEIIEAQLDKDFLILECEHLTDGKCELGHDTKKFDENGAKCPDRLVEYGYLSKSLTCDSCPFRDKEDEHK